MGGVCCACRGLFLRMVGEMNVKEKLHEQFNVEKIAAEPASEKTQLMLFGIGYREGMLAAAEILEANWFKTQQDCSDAIKSAARKV